MTAKPAAGKTIWPCIWGFVPEHPIVIRGIRGKFLGDREGGLPDERPLERLKVDCRSTQDAPDGAQGIRNGEGMVLATSQRSGVWGKRADAFLDGEACRAFQSSMRPYLQRQSWKSGVGDGRFRAWEKSTGWSMLSRR
ncbi:Uu.00g036510.m01.CDS01 [Anthostomella pinea]|uniref:Uu.00g036510.m01.CDS01 n=1 Tax=Anthostomella pinea TaxID=933095 RepID=A0AAI8V4J3_9PEZI|nr:Uu.00g036510.m01.CDS01 [Anthostomella pinea]